MSCLRSIGSFLLVAAVLAALPCRRAFALIGNAPLGVGEIVITEFFEDAYRINPTTGAATLLAFGTFAPADSIVVDRQQRILGLSTSGALVRLDPVTLGVTQLTPTLFFGASDLAIEPSGNVLVTNGSIFRVNVATGATTTLVDSATTNGGFFSPHSIDVGPTGRIFVNEFFEDVWEVNPLTGAATITPKSRDMSQPSLIQVRSDGELIMQEFNTGNLVRVNPTDGAVTTFATGMPSGTSDIALEADNDVVVAANEGVFRVGAAGGMPAVLTPDFSFFSPGAIAVTPAPEPGAGVLGVVAACVGVGRRKRVRSGE